MVSVGPQPRLRRGRAQSPAPVPSTTPDTKRGLPREPGHRRSAPLASSASPHTCSRHDRRPPSTSRRGGDRRAQRLLQSPAFERRIDAGRRVAPRCLAGGGGKRIPVRRHRAHGNTAAGRAEDGRGAPGSRPVEGKARHGPDVAAASPIAVHGGRSLGHRWHGFVASGRWGVTPVWRATAYCGCWLRGRHRPERTVEIGCRADTVAKDG
jgi:hypothetical protein